MFPPHIVPPGVYPTDDGGDVATPVTLIEWFLNHPSLRYGGYHLVALLFFLPVSMLLGSQKYSFSKNTGILFSSFLIILDHFDFFGLSGKISPVCTSWWQK